MKDFGFFKGLPYKESNEDFAAYFMRFSICATYCTLSNTSNGVQGATSGIKKQVV